MSPSFSGATASAATASSSMSPSRYGLFGGRKSDASTTSPTREKGEPMPVELYKMIGDNVPMLMLNRKVAKDIEGASHTRTKWQWKEFENPARKDNLRLAHWERVPSAELADPGEGNPYHFARFNTTTNIYSYSTEEYVSHLRDDTGDWSRQETDYLFKLCHEYDLRWIVIQDRWDYPAPASEAAPPQAGGVSQATDAIAASQPEQPAAASAVNGSQDSNKEGPSMITESPASNGQDKRPARDALAETIKPAQAEDSATEAIVAEPASTQPVASASHPGAPKESKERSIEEMKHRYYSVCRRLIRARPASDETAKAALLQNYLFEKDREIARKRHISDVLLKLTPEQLAEEESLYMESRRLEQTYNKTARQREELWRLLGGVGPQSTSNLALTGSFLTPAAHANAANAAGLAGMNVPNSSKKRRRGELDMLDDPQGGNKAGGAAVQAAIPQFTPEQDAQYGITRLDASSSAVSGGRSANVYVRSLKPPQLKSHIAPKIHEVMQEHRINMRLAMPTRANTEKLESFVQTITALMECKKQIERLEGEVRILNIKKGAAMRINEADKATARAEEEQKRKERASTGMDTPAATPQAESSSSMQIDG